MEVKFVLFQNLLEEDYKDEQIGIMLENNFVLCLCCLGNFEEEDYKIIDQKSIDFSDLGEFLRYLKEQKYKELF